MWRKTFLVKRCYWHTHCASLYFDRPWSIDKIFELHPHTVSDWFPRANPWAHNGVGGQSKLLKLLRLISAKTLTGLKKKIFFFFFFFWLFMFTCVWWSYLYSMIDTAVIFDWLSSTPFLQWICFVFERVGGSSHGKFSCFIRLLTSDVNATFQSSWAFTALLNRLAQVDYNWINQRGEMQSGRLSCRLIMKAWSRLSQSKSLFIGWISWADNER